ncbi:MAG: Lrp/AsnC ligand binding domain-containing protein [Thermoplasmata archaeon]|nr:Lrp/AsnC ligand binding domain-containing protein [Thermoplasmata archaeon]
MRIRKKYLFYVLALASAIIAAAGTTTDTYISMYVSNPWALCLSIFIVGTIVTFLLTSLLSIKVGGKAMGSRIDPSFHGIRLIRKREIKYQTIAGFANAITTLAYFYVIWSYNDPFTPATILAFSQIVIIYLLAIESITEKNAPTLAEVQSAIIVSFGAVLASLSLKGGINARGLAVVFLVLNPSWALFSIYQRKLKLLRINDCYNDAINIRFWNLIFTTFFTFIAIIAMGYAMHEDLLKASLDALSYWNLLAISMTIAFFSYVFYIRALGLGKASVTQAVKSSTIIFSIPFSFWLASVVGGTIFESSLHALIKSMGMAMVILGVISFALTEVKGYVFINAKTGHSIEELIQEIWKIKGIVSIAAVAGSYDIIAKVRIRSLGKGYERIVRALEEIKGIASFKWHSILKEWEEI